MLISTEVISLTERQDNCPKTGLEECKIYIKEVSLTSFSFSKEPPFPKSVLNFI